MVLRSSVALFLATTLLGPCPGSSSSTTSARPPVAPATVGDVHFEPKRRLVDNLYGEDVAVSFDLVNASDHPVRLSAAECRWGNLRVDTPAGDSIPACKLKGGLPSPLGIAAGAHVTLVAAFDGALACEPSSREEFPLRAWIDDASEPIEASIQWWRRQLVAVHGDTGDLGEIGPRETLERRFTLESEELGRFEVNYVGIPSDDPRDSRIVAALDVKGRDVTAPGAALTTYEVAVRIDAARLPYGDGWVQLVASLSRARVRRIPINLRWNIPPPFELLLDGKPVPESLSLGFVKASDKPLRRAVFHSRDSSHPVRVRAARFETRRDGSRFEVTAGSFDAGDTPIEFMLPVAPESRTIAGDLVVETDDPRAPAWRKRVTAVRSGVAAPPAGK